MQLYFYQNTLMHQFDGQPITAAGRAGTRCREKSVTSLFAQSAAEFPLFLRGLLSQAWASATAGQTAVQNSPLSKLESDGMTKWLSAGGHPH
jgi:hypothetical protein